MGPAYQIRDVFTADHSSNGNARPRFIKVYSAHYVLSAVSVGLSIYFVGLIADAFGARTVYLLGGLFVCSSIQDCHPRFFMRQKKRAADSCGGSFTFL
ncbi:hypothetical protein ACEQPO_05385 [Bacillus sp. SL00103]